MPGSARTSSASDSSAFGQPPVERLGRKALWPPHRRLYVRRSAFNPVARKRPLRGRAPASTRGGQAVASAAFSAGEAQERMRRIIGRG